GIVYGKAHFNAFFMTCICKISPFFLIGSASSNAIASKPIPLSLLSHRKGHPLGCPVSSRLCMQVCLAAFACLRQDLDQLERLRRTAAHAEITIRTRRSVEVASSADEQLFRLGDLQQSGHRL